MSYRQLQLGRDGRAPITVRVFESASPAKATVIVPSAMGVAQSFYALFAEWLAGQGYTAITFDYRGIGLSAPQSLRGFEVNIFDWARDSEAAIEFAFERSADRPLYWVGHSLGGQLLGLIENRDRLRKVVTVATGNGYWLENSWPTKRRAWLLWFFAVPLATRSMGYFPGKRLGMIADLPRGVIEQWRRWCLDREYVVGAEGDDVRAAYADVRLPIMSLSFTDDEMMSERSIRSLHALYRNAPLELRRMAPRDVGVERIGHFGFFRAQFESTLWPMVTRFIEAN